MSNDKFEAPDRPNQATGYKMDMDMKSHSSHRVHDRDCDRASLPPIRSFAPSPESSADSQAGEYDLDGAQNPRRIPVGRTPAEHEITRKQIEARARRKNREAVERLRRAVRPWMGGHIVRGGADLINIAAEVLEEYTRSLERDTSKQNRV